MPGAVPTKRRKPMSIDFGPVSGCVHHDPKLLKCETALSTTDTHKRSPAYKPGEGAPASNAILGRMPARGTAALARDLAQGMGNLYLLAVLIGNSNLD